MPGAAFARRCLFRRGLGCALAVSVTAVAGSAGQPAGSQAAVAQQAGLRIVVIEGEDAINIIQQKTAVAPVVEVRDRNDLPVSGATVTFAISGGNTATFAGGVQTLTVTTNAAGRAVVGALNPLSSGVVQINVQAAFQGQTAVAAIAQTNVLTAAEAAAVSGAGGAASGTTAPGGAAGAGGGGLSGTTLGVVGGAAAGGALVAANAFGGGSEAAATSTSTYRGSFSMQSVYNETTTTNGVVTGFCANQVVTITGTITITLDEKGAGHFDANGTQAKAAAGQCSGSAPSFSMSEKVSSASNITLASEGSSEFESGTGTRRIRRLRTFSGALDGNVVNGTMTISEDVTLIAPAGPGIVFTGGFPAASTAVTLTKQ